MLGYVISSHSRIYLDAQFVPEKCPDRVSWQETSTYAGYIRETLEHIGAFLRKVGKTMKHISAGPG
jgi:hypothetical protein